MTTRVFRRWLRSTGAAEASPQLPLLQFAHKPRGSDGWLLICQLAVEKPADVIEKANPVLIAPQIVTDVVVDE